ncbi:MAG: AMP-binding protein [Acidimicrobiales bacterium]
MSLNWVSVVWSSADRWPGRAAIVDGDTVVDYATLRERAANHAHVLADAGVRPGERVGLLFRRTPEVAAALFGTWAAGAVAVVIADVLQPRQIEHVIRHSGAKVLVTEGDQIRHHRELDIQATTLAPPPTGDEAGSAFAVLPRDGGDVAQLVYTSGSTGLPKGVTVTHANLHAGVESVGRYLRVDASDRLVSLLPFSFDYGLNQLLVAIAAGAALVIERSPIAARIDRTLRTAEVTVVAGVPTLWNQLLQVASFRHEPIESVRAMTNTGGRLPEETVRQLRVAQPQAALFSMYGLTEAFRSTYLDPSLVDRKPTSVGKAIPGAEVWVMRPDRSPCRPHEVGEIVHRGPTVTLGYWDDQATTDRMFRCGARHPDHPTSPDCVVHSGDFGWVDDDGDLYIEGRRDRLVKRLGYRISPDEVAEAIFASRLVRDACVTTSQSDGQDPDIIGHVVLHDGADIDQLGRHLAVELPRHLRPSQLVAHDRLPTTPNGKHDVHALAGATG